MRLLVIAKEIEGTLDVRYLFRVKTELVTITGKTDDTVYRLTEDVARFEQQKTKTTDDMTLPCNLVFKPCGFLCMFRFLAVQFGPVLGLQLHQLTTMVVLYGLDFIL